MKETITSTKNPKIKEILALDKANHRKKTNLIIVEGYDEVVFALNAGVKIKSVFYADELSDKKIPAEIDCSYINMVTKEVFEKIAYREGPDGFMAIAERPVKKIKDIKLNKNPLVVVLEGIEKPGNVGAILRTADAAGATAVLICDNKIDLYNPNVIRSSRGTIFTEQVVSCSSNEALSWLEENKIKIFAATSHAKKVYTDIRIGSSAAIVIGAEHSGLTKNWLDKASEKIKIPMLGKINCLNASVSAAVVLYEAVRQRKIK